MTDEKQRLIDKVFTSGLRKKADEIVAKYETRRASILMILRLVQDHYGYINDDARNAVAGYLDLPEIDVYEVLTFYSLFYQKPRAKTEFHVCRTLACSLTGSGRVVKCLKEKLGTRAGEVTADGEFMYEEVECLGACEIAPMMQLNEGEYIGNLTPEKIETLINEARSGKLEELKKAKRPPVCEEQL